MHDHADTSPARQPIWHEGERFLQQRLGMAERMAEVGPRIVRDFMPDQHRDFYEQLPFIVMASVDGAGDAWATIVEGQSGFIASPTPTALDIAARLDADDPAQAGLHDGAAVGLLGIELHTRRRNRMNGVATITPRRAARRCRPEFRQLPPLHPVARFHVSPCAGHAGRGRRGGKCRDRR